jgi:hypothetical protein
MEKIQVALMSSYDEIKAIFELTEEQYALLQTLEKMDLLECCYLEKNFVTKIEKKA